ncbi:MAG: ATP-binding protein, partial [Bacteroidota bacterium]
HILEKEYGNLSETGKDYFKRMQSAAERMQALINDLLTYSRTSDQDDKLESLDLDEIVKEVEADLQEEVQTSKAVIQFNQLGKIHAIPFQVRQLVYNLVSNSLKFSDPMRAAVISIKSRMVKGSELAHGSLVPDQEYYHISIADNGIGFDQVYSEKIFELFQRLHPQDKYKGTGIGLAIVKRIVENHKGIVTVSSAINQGTTFNVYLSAF